MKNQKTNEFEKKIGELEKKTELFHQMKQKAEENEKKFFMLFNACPEPLSVTSLHDGRIITVNDAFLKRTGFLKEEIINRSSSELNAWLSVDERQKWKDELLKNGSIQYMEIPFRMKNSEIRNYLVSTEIIELDNEKCTINFYMDVTEQKRTENELQLAKEQAEEREKELKRKNDELEIINKELIRAKEKAENFSKKLQETERQLKLKLDFILSPDNSIEEISLTELIDVELLQKIQDSFVKATGVASIITDVYGTPITKPSNFCGVCKLIRKTEKGLQNCMESDKLIGLNAGKEQKPSFKDCYSCGFIDAGAPIIVAGKQLAIWMIGQSNVGKVDKERILKYSHEIGANSELMLGEYKKMKNMSIQQFENVTNFLWLLAQEISNLAYNNIKLAKSIQEARTHEAELILSKEKAEESDRLKTAFLQNMSHEIRTPLNAISGFSGLLGRDGLTDEKRKSYVHIIQNSSNQLITIVNDILTISSLETKQEEISLANVCVNEIILELVAKYEQQANNQNISLYAKQYFSDNQSVIHSDRSKIVNVLTNLLSNGLKFTHEGSVEFGYDVIDENNKIFLRFFVKDSGIGIKPEFHNKIFERFRQADNSTKKLYGGTGLGLSISKGFTELLGGRIWVESEFGKGSTFYFTIPYKPVIPNANPLKTIINTTKVKMILIAEDEEYNYLYIEEILINLDVNLLHAKNGKEAIEMVKQNKEISLILMDIKMPEINGYEATRVIKSLRPELPVIAQSAYALEHEIVKYKEIFNDYLTKPINREELMKTISKYISQ